MLYGYAVIRLKPDPYDEYHPYVYTEKVRLYKTAAERDNGIYLEWVRLRKKHGNFLGNYNVTPFITKLPPYLCINDKINYEEME